LLLPEKIAKSHLLRLNRMLGDIDRASRDLEALRSAYLNMAVEPAAFAITPSPAAVISIPGQGQAQRCKEIVEIHVVLKDSIEQALAAGTTGKQVTALQEQLDALEDERDTLDAELRCMQRQLAMRRFIVMDEDAQELPMPRVSGCSCQC
jgi:hypothetical protein